MSPALALAPVVPRDRFCGKAERGTRQTIRLAVAVARVPDQRDFLECGKCRNGFREQAGQIAVSRCCRAP
jgi:hypothetical protein